MDYSEFPKSTFYHQEPVVSKGISPMAKEIKTPKVEELWMFWDIGTKDWIVAWDGPRKCNAYLCATSDAAAKAVQKHQKELYEIKSVPVRVI